MGPPISFPVFCINLDRSPERLAFMEEQADCLGFAFQRIAGVDGVSAVPERLREQFFITNGEIGSALNSGEVGCYASHLLAYERISALGAELALVLEDDVVLAADFVATAQAAIQAAPPQWDCLHLSTDFKRTPFSIAALPQGRSLVRYARLPVNTAAYVINRSGVAKMLKPRARVRPVDQEIRHAWLSNLSVLGVFPAPAQQSKAFSSTIDQRRRMQWAPNLLSRIRGAIFIRRQLGARGSLSCWQGEIRRRFGDGQIRV